MLPTHASPVTPTGRAAWHPSTHRAPPEESGIPSSSPWHPSRSPLSHPTADAGGTGAKGERGRPPSLARAGPDSSCAPGAALGAPPAAAASALGRGRAQPFLPGTQRGVALSRQVPINGVFYLTGEIKSPYKRSAKELSQQLAGGRQVQP